MEVAIRGTTNVTAYILKQPCIADGKNHFGLFVVDHHNPNHPKKLLEAQYLGDLSWHPGTSNWSMRADFGGGVQLYDVTEDGLATLIVSNPETAVVGGSESLVTDPAKDGPFRDGLMTRDSILARVMRPILKTSAGLQRRFLLPGLFRTARFCKAAPIRFHLQLLRPME